MAKMIGIIGKYLYKKNKTVWEATLNIANTANGEKISYDIKPIKKMEEGIKSPSTSTNSNIHQNNTKSQGKSSEREIQYTYNTLVSKPDMVVTKLTEGISLSRAEIIREAKKNATVIGKKHNDGSISVLFDDIDTDVVISTDSIKHSLDRRIKVYGPVMLQKRNGRA